ncbi:hypothetical protein HMI54_000658 [Coelomomyces lativittatus]|nr:hypothetical protein HMI55_004750 [Coelomomyces lativittatus]KAJ1509920.1 hypothetical protein HMI56_006578 [Coelomomyces lativittatus]KAJ1511603.1 hypothetical protein HMI54_000658 [Coelomomyces lativittatus]
MSLFKKIPFSFLSIVSILCDLHCFFFLFLFGLLNSSSSFYFFFPSHILRPATLFKRTHSNIIHINTHPPLHDSISVYKVKKDKKKKILSGISSKIKGPSSFKQCVFFFLSFVKPSSPKKKNHGI